MAALRLDFHTTLLFALTLSLLFTAAVALLWPVLHGEAAYRRLLLWNALVVAVQVLRLSVGDEPSRAELAAYWSLVLLANAAFCAAALAMANRLHEERALIVLGAALLALLWVTAWMAESQQPLGLVVGVGSAALYTVAAVVMFRIGKPALAPRYVLSLPFAFAAALAWAYSAMRVAELQHGVDRVPASALAHFLAELIFVCGNLVTLLWLFLRQQRLISNLARTDALTGALNRRGLEQALAGARREGALAAPSAIVMADIDHFKRINDMHGHRAGDAVLRQFSALVVEHKRPQDLFARLGGEEYCVLMPQTSAADAARWAEQLRATVQALPVSGAQGERLQMTASFGVAEVPPMPEHWQQAFDDALARADDALYAAKAAGRNRVVVGAPR
jgi:diguanylate cyclase (GGDEF)-like protein